MSLEKIKAIREMSTAEILELPHSELKDDDYVLVPRFPPYFKDECVTKREYEAWRERVLSKPLP